MQQQDISVTNSRSVEEIFLERLRRSTASCHKKLESHPLSVSLMQPSVSLEAYADYLIAMGAIMKEYDAVILPFLEILLPDWQIRRKSAAIENDIAYLEKKEITIRKKETFSIAELKNPAIAFGIAYVLEGSTLGGRVIIKHLQRFFPVTEAEGAQFFAGYGSNTGLRWKHFVHYLTNFAITQKCEDDIIAGAQACFALIYNHFDKSCILDEL